MLDWVGFSTAEDVDAAGLNSAADGLSLDVGGALAKDGRLLTYAAPGDVLLAVRRILRDILSLRVGWSWLRDASRFSLDMTAEVVNKKRWARGMMNKDRRVTQSMCMHSGAPQTGSVYASDDSEMAVLTRFKYRTDTHSPQFLCRRHATRTQTFWANSVFTIQHLIIPILSLFQNFKLAACCL